MRAYTPQKSTEASRSKISVGEGHRTSFGGSIPRVTSRIAQARAANSQPAFDFLTGAETTARPPSRGTYRQSTRISSNEFQGRKSVIESDEDREKRRRELDDLRAEIKTLRYTIDNHKQEEELAKLRHESEIRDARRKGEDDFKKMQAADAEKSKVIRQHEMLLKEVTEVRDAASNEKAALERRVREAEEGKRILEEEAQDARVEIEESSRNLDRKTRELEARNDTLQRTVQELQQDSDSREALLQETQQQLLVKDTAIGELEADILRLKAQTGDAEVIGVIKRELSEQVSHIRALEATNREQAAELKHFKRLHKSIEVVEEEKRSLQRKVDAIEGLEAELGEARIQRQRLEDERLAWTAYLQAQAGEDGQIEFDSPEALARALVEERLQTAALVERLGSLESEASEKDAIIESLEAEKSNLIQQAEKLKLTNAAAGNNKIQLRLERQRALAIKEAEYLRAQLRTYDTEDATFHAENVDEAKLKRVTELEDMVDQYRQEVQSLHNELSTREQPAPLHSTELTSSLKRPRGDAEESERLGQLSRKTRKLQDDLSTLQTRNKVLQKELSVAQERLSAATQHSQTRILSLRNNPTSTVEAIKLSTLNALRQENADLLSQLQNSSSTTSTVPTSSLTASQHAVSDALSALQTERTRNDRLKKVWLAKSQEFRELVISLLGWDVTFMRDGKTRVTSFFYPSKDDEENSILFDGENGTMKVSGGTQSKFAMKIMDQIRFWVRDRGSIPCFLAALTLEFYEEANKDKTLRIDA